MVFKNTILPFEARLSEYDGLRSDCAPLSSLALSHAMSQPPKWIVCIGVPLEATVSSRQDRWLGAALQFFGLPVGPGSPRYVITPINDLQPRVVPIFDVYLVLLACPQR